MASGKVYHVCNSTAEASRQSDFPNIKAFGSKDHNRHYIEKALNFFRKFEGQPYTLENFETNLDQCLKWYKADLGMAGMMFTRVNDAMTLAMATHDIVVCNY